MNIDKLLLLLGDDYEINEHIKIKQPTLRDVANYREDKYWGLITTICATSFDLRFQLDDMGFDYEDVDDFTVFGLVAPGMSLEDTRILFGDFDFQKLKPILSEEEIILVNEETGAVIDRIIYELIVGYIRNVHGLKRNYKVAGNKAARKFYMEEERRQLEEKAASNKNENKSMFASLISSMINVPGFNYNYSSIWDLKVYQFMDACKRARKIMDYKNLMTGVYTGKIDGKSLHRNQIDWQGEL